MNKKIDWIKILDIASTIMAIGGTIIAGWVNDQKIDKEISEKVSKALDK